jgi:YesN/AraC family two-component response regulator
LSAQLEELGAGPVDKALNGRDALDKVRANLVKPECPNHQPYKVIMTDKNMPIMDGI